MTALSTVALHVLSVKAALPVPEEQARRFNFPRCVFCRRRPQLRPTPGAWLRFKTGLDEPAFVDVPRYEILPCCTSRYVKENQDAKA